MKAALCTVTASICFAVLFPDVNLAQYPKNWWPDPSTGLMWSGEMAPNQDSIPFGTRIVNGLTWQQATDYCNSLQLTGYSGWRLPTLDEMKAVTVVKRRSETASAFVDPGNRPGATPVLRDVTSSYQELLFKGGIYDGWDYVNNTYSFDPSREYGTEMAVWTSTQSTPDLKSAWIVRFLKSPKAFQTKDLEDQNTGVICVRTMEPDILAASKAAGEAPPVPDVASLQNYVPLNKARLAYQAGNYQEAITQAQAALTLKTNPATANWAIGISYGRLGQWDKAMASFQSALALERYNGDAVTGLTWAKDGQKAAKKGKKLKDPSPVWN